MEGQRPSHHLLRLPASRPFTVSLNLVNMKPKELEISHANPLTLTLVNRLVYAPAAVLCCFSALALITACRTLEDGELEGNDMVMLTHSDHSLPLGLCGFNVLINEIKELVLS